MAPRKFASIFLVAILSVPSHAIKVEKIQGLLGGGRTVEVAAEEVLVRFDPAVSASQHAAVLSSVGGLSRQDLPFGGWALIALPPGSSVAAALGALRNRPGVLQVQPNHVYRPIRLP